MAEGQYVGTECPHCGDSRLKLYEIDDGDVLGVDRVEGEVVLDCPACGKRVATERLAYEDRGNGKGRARYRDRVA